MSVITDKKDLENFRESGRRLAKILRLLEKECVPGASSVEINKMAEKLIQKGGDRPAFLGYQPSGADRPFPAALCFSVNDEVVHGIPNEAEKILKNGDIVCLDIGLMHNGMVTDMAVTVPVGDVNRESRRLISATKKALDAAIGAARAGGRIGDIGAAVEDAIKDSGFAIVEELGGHGVGYKVHEEPFIANYGRWGTGAKIVPNMTLALEPIITAGGKDVVLDDDGYTFKTADGKRSAQFEHTVLVTEDSAEIITKI